MKHAKKMFVLLMAAALLLTIAPAISEDGGLTLPEMYLDFITESGASDSYVLYPVLKTPDENAAGLVAAINQTIQTKARIPEYLQMLPTIREGSTGLRFDVEIGVTTDPWNDERIDSRFLSLLFCAEGKMLQGRPSQVYYPLTIDLLTGGLVTFDQLFSDPDGARAFIEGYLETDVEPTLSTYLENNQLFPVPYDRFFLDGAGNLILAYENSQLSFLSGYSGAVAFRYSELKPWLDASPEGVPMQLSWLFRNRSRLGELWNETEVFWEDLQHDSLSGLLPMVLLTDQAEDYRQMYRCTADSGSYPGGAYFEVEEPRLRGTLILTDESEEIVTGILTSRADLPGIVTGETTLDDAEAFLGVAPALRMEITTALAGIYLVCPGEASIYQTKDIDGHPLSLTLYADANGVVQYVKYAYEP